MNNEVFPRVRFGKNTAYRVETRGKFGLEETYLGRFILVEDRWTKDKGWSFVTALARPRLYADDMLSISARIKELNRTKKGQ
jgi:hypothetical protein